MTVLRAFILVTLFFGSVGESEAETNLPATIRLSLIEDAAEKRVTIDQIKGDLRHADPETTLVDCTILINYVEQMPSGHDTGYGGACQVVSRGKATRITLCNDRMVGKFFESAQVVDEPEQIGFFIHTHCPPGG